MEERKCTNCGSKELEEVNINFPFSEGIVETYTAYADSKTFNKLSAYVCKKCGHVELYLNKKNRKVKKVK